MKICREVEKRILWGSSKVLPNQVSKNPSLRSEILTYVSYMQSYTKKRVKRWELIQCEG